MTTTICIASKFLSTLSLRRATAPWSARLASRVNFYPRSPCGERQNTLQYEYYNSMNFYPRSPCGERHPNMSSHPHNTNFYPRSPCGERHANLRCHRSDHHFYPRSPCGERPKHSTNPKSRKRNFYPRSPCGERPYIIRHAVDLHPISIHALLAESDCVFFVV